jgi:S-formylglutathione hydrolase FrmB
MGGFGAINLALHHPELYSFAGALSPAIDVPRRAFSIRRLQQSMAFRSLFGTGDARQHHDPFVAAQRANPGEVPYFLTVGDRESLLSPNREFATMLKKRALPHEFHVVQGGHDWRQWNNQLPSLFDRLMLVQRVMLPQ